MVCSGMVNFILSVVLHEVKYPLLIHFCLVLLLLRMALNKVIVNKPSSCDYCKVLFSKTSVNVIGVFSNLLFYSASCSFHMMYYILLGLLGHL